jgi:hypothetical protein
MRETTTMNGMQKTGEAEGMSAMEFCGAVSGVIVIATAVKIVGRAIERKAFGEQSRVPEIVLRGKIDPATGEATLTVIDSAAQKAREEEAKKAEEKKAAEDKKKAEKAEKDAKKPDAEKKAA